METQLSRLVGFAISGHAQRFFVHDFVAVDLPFDAVVSAFVNYLRPEGIAPLILEAWRAESGELGRVLQEPLFAGEEPMMHVQVGRVRNRGDAVVVAIAWSPAPGSWIAPLEADLELVAFGPSRTHLHLLGRSELPPGVDLCTARASIEHRLAIAVVRHMLSSLAALLTANSSKSP